GATLRGPRELDLLGLAGPVEAAERRAHLLEAAVAGGARPPPAGGPPGPGGGPPVAGAGAGGAPGGGRGATRERAARPRRAARRGSKWSRSPASWDKKMYLSTSAWSSSSSCVAGNSLRARSAT